MINDTIIAVNKMDISLSHHVVSMGLHNYCKQLGMLDKIEEIKQQIDKYLKVNEIYDIKCFQYSEHADFIKESIKYIATDENYNLDESIKDYMQNYIDDYKAKHVAVEEHVKHATDFVIFMDKNRKIIEEIRQLQKQIL